MTETEISWDQLTRMPQFEGGQCEMHFKDERFIYRCIVTQLLCSPQTFSVMGSTSIRRETHGTTWQISRLQSAQACGCDLHNSTIELNDDQTMAYIVSGNGDRFWLYAQGSKDCVDFSTVGPR